MTIKNKKAIITGYYNNDFYAEECFNSNIGYDKRSICRYRYRNNSVS